MSLTAYKLIVSKPCHEDWSSMTPAGNGRHCQSCNKSVIDFSGLADHEIKSFFIKNENRPVCGRFKTVQLERVRIYVSNAIFNKPGPYWKKFLVIFLVCFGSNLYPFDTLIGSSTSLYAQSSINKTGEKKIHPTHKRKKSRIYIKNLPQVETGFEWVTMGFTQSIPSVENSYPEAIAVDNIYITADQSQNSAPEQLKDTDTNKPAKPVNKPYPENRKEYILPQRLKLRGKQKRA